MLCNSRFAIFNGFALKIIALISMTCDHVAVALVNKHEYPELYDVMRGIGRIAFPIFCFLLVEGFLHTHDVKRYMLRLFAFAIISEVPFDLIIGSSSGLDFNHQNVYFTLGIGLLALCCIREYADDPYMQLIVIIISLVVAYLLKTDYNYNGIIQIMIFYFLREHLLYKSVGIAVLNSYMNQPAGAAALLFTGLYNGRRGPAIKYIFYIYYPLHLTLLYLIKYFIRYYS